MRLTHDLHASAPVDRLWSLTTDLEGWPSLTPTVTEVTRHDAGPLRVGSSALVRQPRLRPATWTVTRVEAPHHFAWETATRGLRMVATHRLAAEADGCRATLELELTGPVAGVLGRIAGGQLRRALATENDGFRRGAEGLERPTFVDEHRIRLEVPPEAAWPAVREYAGGLAGSPDHRVVTMLLGLLGTSPSSGFAVADEVDGRRVGLSGRHRFSRYWLDVRVDPVVGPGCEVALVTYADFPGPRGRAYRAAVVGSRGHVLAVRRMLASIREAV